MNKDIPYRYVVYYPGYFSQSLIWEYIHNLPLRGVVFNRCLKLEYDPPLLHTADRKLH